MSLKPPTRSAWSRLQCRKVGWIMVSQGAVMFGLSGCVVLRHRMNTTIVLARRPINAAVVASSQARWCTASRCAERRVVFWQNHTRAGTVPDQRGRCGLNYGMFSQVAACFVPLRPGGSRLLTKLVQARSRINAGGLGWSVSGSVVSRQGNVGWCWSVQGTATYRHRGRRGEASTPRGGMRLVTARPGKVRRGESRHGVVRPPSR